MLADGAKRGTHGQSECARVSTPSKKLTRVERPRNSVESPIGFCGVGRTDFSMVLSGRTRSYYFVLAGSRNHPAACHLLQTDFRIVRFRRGRGDQNQRGALTGASVRLVDQPFSYPSVLISNIYRQIGKI